MDTVSDVMYDNNVNSGNICVFSDTDTKTY